VVSFTVQPLYLWERAPGTHWIIGLKAVAKGKILNIALVGNRTLTKLLRLMCKDI
jgi:hypothetical protein